ncbi:MAG: MerR family transcriptional regulator [Spirochaetaceae bacterium]|nr:MerR family transcriptional regulator [Spirochaetaceae bacterium]MBR6566058.1 MerR family transcriptional regulator [Spirochaetaceae bacterium]
MAAYSIGEMEELTGIKAHVLRYWEEVIPSLAPKKDLGGRRSYSQRDFQTIMRLKYLIQERRFTIEGARSEMIAEATSYVSSQQELSVALETISEIRSSLTDLYLLVKKYRTSGGSADGSAK